MGDNNAFFNHDNSQGEEQSGFQEYPDGLLDHLAEAEDRAELDLFDNGNNNVKEHVAYMPSTDP